MSCACYRISQWAGMISLAAALSCISVNAIAGCDEIRTQCLVIAQGVESTEACEITTCANTSEYITQWTLANGGAVSEHSDSQSNLIKVNEQAGILLPSSILKPSLTCYASKDGQIVYCAKDAWL
ncbi:hypothetical protein ACRZ5S_14940 [Vibrio scophthalmi]|uniref:hypothetical protein n=1 Tax=Vibrio scophthalmi TaxID=45658 RepID=UPI003EBF3B65